MWVKICGNTNLDDALLATQLGADAVGFVFAPSARQVTTEQVKAITPHIPDHVKSVGVFPAWTADTITATVQQAGLTAVQLHGDYDPALVRSLRTSLPTAMTLIQAMHWPVGSVEKDALTLIKRVGAILATRQIDYVLIDSKLGSSTGGTGVSFEWNAARDLFGIYPNLILAGGLRPENVYDAVATLHPWGVDVASGVEAAAGKKDPAKLEQFVARAKLL